ncbi:hypothetical protein [Nocardia alni]|uniref:hypothetical protein n=1 Tax=Nocardia alni TaxID=2815723 RepID=UPI001C2418FA|nr:hypothetical protein [Nocardia alni]
MTARTDLVQELNAPVAAAELLSEREVTDLLALFRAARKTEVTAVATAIDGMVTVLPRAFRGIAKRIMFGDLSEL